MVFDLLGGAVYPGSYPVEGPVETEPLPVDDEPEELSSEPVDGWEDELPLDEEPDVSLS